MIFSSAFTHLQRAVMFLIALHVALKRWVTFITVPPAGDHRCSILLSLEFVVPTMGLVTSGLLLRQLSGKKSLLHTRYKGTSLNESISRT